MSLCSVQVSVSVYGSHEASPSRQPSASSPAPVGLKHTVSDTPVAQRNDDVTSQQLSARLKDSSLPSPTPGSVGERDKEGEEEEEGEEGSGKDRQPHQLTGKEKVEKRVGGGGAPDLVINVATEDQDAVPGTSTNITTTVSREMVDEGNENQHTLPTEPVEPEKPVGKKTDEQQPSPTRSDYRTPSPISDTHLQELSSGPAAGAGGGGGGDGGGGGGDGGGGGGGGGDDERDTADGIIFQPHAFPSVEPTATTGSREDEGGVVKPKPHLLRSSELAITGEDGKPHATSAFTRLSPSREPVFVEDGSTISSVASSFRDTSNHLRKDYSSLSLDRHSDMEESGVHIETGHARRDGEDRGGGRGGRGGVRWGVEGGEGLSYLFPVSNSPVDLVTMLTRLAYFTSTLLTTLTPKLRHAAVPGLDEPRVRSTFQTTPTAKPQRHPSCVHSLS